MEIICFHNPDEENGYLSNWFHSDFSIDEIEFSSMEQYMMYKKAVCFSDKKIAEEILSINDVAEIKRLGRQIIMIIFGMERDRLLCTRDFWQNFLRIIHLKRC